MSPIGPDDFGDFFRALHGYEPFDWQRRLAQRVAVRRWPRALPLPTASGKTACIDIAVFALACQATRPRHERTAARRVFFVVDRRVIVDQAHERARAIADRLRTGRAHDGTEVSILSRVAAALRALGGPGPDGRPLDPLAAFQLRGGIYRDQAWARTPTQPTVIASTVDQVGSRLLFRGYGVSDPLRPIHAGLAANDSLILLDEAHCARPFQQTADAVRAYRGWATEGVRTPFDLAILSATPAHGAEGPGGHGEDDPFGPIDLDREPEELRRRLLCPKPVSLVRADVPKGPGGARRFAARLVEVAAELAERHGLRTVAILVNRVATAEDVYRRCRERWPDADGEDRVALMTGRMRPLDRDRLLDDWEPRLQAGRDRPEPSRPVFVVATQCLEVGADFDFDAVVSECASLDALRQRFGRLNRLGRRDGARGAIVIRSDQIRSDEDLDKDDPSRDDPIYGKALAATWNWLWDRSAPGAGDEEGRRAFDFGVDALERTLPVDEGERRRVLGRLQPPAVDAPVMLPAHVDFWVQTAPRPEPDPDVALFLHGPEQGRPEVQVCWRADLDLDFPGNWVDTVSLCPPSRGECMPIPLHLVRGWLHGGDVHGADAGDLEHAPAVPSENDTRPRDHRLALLWRGPQDEGTGILQDARDLRPGDTVVIPADERGWESFAHLPRDQADPGHAEVAYRNARRRAILRLHPDLMATWPASPERDTLRRLASGEDEPEDRAAEIREALLGLAGTEGCPEWLRAASESLGGDNRLKILPYPDETMTDSGMRNGVEETGRASDRSPRRGLVLLGSETLGPLPGRPDEDDTATTEDDSASTASYRDEPVFLDDHVRGVSDLTDHYAHLCGLPGPLRQTLALAARWHDLGKADPRFQAWLHKGNARAADVAPRLLAKGLRQDRRQRERDRDASGYPSGARHELVSARLAEVLSGRLDEPVDRDLLLHLIASHHGHARPFVPFYEEAADLIVSCERLGLDAATPAATGLHRLGSGVAERFWCLVRRYGWWGLAYLESILRLADHRRSESERAG
jgi:CRISPR-associated endonuclease/helicase Cas3